MTAGGHIKDNSSTKETKFPWVMNVSSLLFISFGIYSSFNPSCFHLSRVFRAWHMVTTPEGLFKRHGFPHQNESGPFDHLKHSASLQFTSQLEESMGRHGLTILVNEIILFKLRIRDLFCTSVKAPNFLHFAEPQSSLGVVTYCHVIFHSLITK